MKSAQRAHCPRIERHFGRPEAGHSSRTRRMLTALVVATTFLTVLGISEGAQAAGKTATTTTVTFAAPALAGSPLTLTATVTPTTTDGSVAFAVTMGRVAVALPADCAAASLVGGVATCTFTPASARTYKAVAKYSGSQSDARSTGRASAIVRVATTTTVTDDATTVPGAPAPVTFGAAITFTARISSADTVPAGTVQWALTGDGPDYASTGSGIAGACQGPVPVVAGVATCQVTPGYYYDDPTESAQLDPYFWGIQAAATFTPTRSSFMGSSGSDDTDKITVDNDYLAPFCTHGIYYCTPFVVINANPGDFFTTTAHVSDSLNRDLDYYWCTNDTTATPCPQTTAAPTIDVYPNSGLTTVSLLAVCPAGVTPYNQSWAWLWHGSMECNYPTINVNLKNEARPGPS